MKRSFLSILAILFSLTILSSCSNEPAKTETAAFSLDSAKAAIAASNIAFGESWATGDSVKFANRYTSDGVMNPPR